MILATITLTFTLNNVILLMNFLSMITIVGIELSVSNIEINLLILVIYESSLLCLFLVNGILLMSSLTFNFRISVNNLLIIPSFHSVFPSVFLFQSIHYFDSNSSLFLYFPFLFNASVLTFGFERVGNLLFDNSLFPLIVLIFLVSIVNILILFNKLLLLILNIVFVLHSSFTFSIKTIQSSNYRVFWYCLTIAGLTFEWTLNRINLCY